MNYWRTTDGRVIEVRDLTDEHLINILNWIEDATPPGTLSSDQLDSYRHLRIESHRRKLHWRRFRGRPLRDGQLSGSPNLERSVRTVREVLAELSRWFEEVGYRSKDFYKFNSSTGKVVDTKSDKPLGDGRPTYRDWFEMKTYGATEDGRFCYVSDEATQSGRFSTTGSNESNRPKPRRELIRLGSLRSGERFRFPRTREGVFYMKIDPVGEVSRGLTSLGHTLEIVPPGCRHYKGTTESGRGGDTSRCVIINLAEGIAYLHPCYEWVYKQ